MTRHSRREVLAGLVALAVVRPTRAANRRLVTLGSAITETVFALGAGGDVVAVDESSQYPRDTHELPQLGYYRQISAEGILALGPTDVLTTVEAGPDAALAQLRTAGLTVHRFDAGHGVEPALRRVQAIGDAIGAAAAAERLARAMGARFAEAERLVAADARRPRVLFVQARGSAAMSVAGAGTAADAMLTLAGTTNAAAALRGYRPLTPEAAVAAAPDVILTTTLTVRSVGGEDAIRSAPGISLLPARLVVRDDLRLLGFGPRSGDEAVELVAALR
jgi:iron complex transport system substrate-binding protein